ncbi:DUF4331 domain-containing protein [Hymenobacter sp. ASUV-10]|uniref:DUF4331 domain-containing protein n=1 Tax=Hymenobacter aranciens TaxID=3063996 RepID=A0ABT9B9D7_9BACT|nr:DUF4331 domain-containing protein [Hymenobacter sp. ASUV-10]MDO7874881.1 DUF4331 domain-containing protein [Hymenobacter sp. ASUV-10]
MKKNLTRPAIVLTAAVGVAAGAVLWSGSQQPLEASSHREAPMIANDPLADVTDVYAFRAPNDPTRVVLIADYVPFQLPQGGPNYYTFGENIRYEIHVKNDGATNVDNVTYRFTFTRSNTDPSTFFNIRLGAQNLKTTYICEKSVNGGAFTTIVSNGVVPAYNIGPRSISGAAGLNQPDYTAYRQTTVANATGGGGEQIFCGPSDDPFFVDLGAAFDLAGFRINQGARDGLARYNVQSIAISAPISTLQKNGQPVSAATSILDPNYVIGVWASASRPSVRTLSTTGAPTTDNATYVQVSRLGMPLLNEAINPIGAKDAWNRTSPYAEAAVTDDYLSNPELSLYMADDVPVAPAAPKTTATTYYGEAVPALMQLRVQTKSLAGFPGLPANGFDFRNNAAGLSGLAGSSAVAGTALAPIASGGYGEYLLVAGKPRSVDIKPIFHSGVPNVAPYQLATGKNGNPLAAGKPFVNNFLLLTGGGPHSSDMLRLNMAVPPTPRNSADFSNQGLIAAAVLGITDSRFNASTAIQNIPNMDGFPNGRRLEDDVTKIELQAVSGAVLAAIGLWYDDYTPTSPSPATPRLAGVLNFATGVEKNDTTFRSTFPYVQTPWQGFATRR